MRELEREDIVCAPFQTPEEAVKDPQVAAALVPVPDSSGQTLCHTVASPVDISDVAQHVTRPRGAVPRLGEHTEEVLRECGFPEHDLQVVLSRASSASEEKPIFRGRL
jgi:crotonobetainyl-CoA:carnitine CoA-transferase CaiB-like acyl-CoA transferase